MNLDRLKFVKNIDDPERWAYADWNLGSQQHLHWANTKGDSANADKADLLPSQYKIRQSKRENNEPNTSSTSKAFRPR